MSQFYRCVGCTKMSVRLRFPPSPTGFLHVGGARTALFNYAFARKHNGVFVLRVEDTDLERSKPEYTQEIMESMEWLGMKCDEGPFFQTQRFPQYHAHAQKLLAAGHLYACDCTNEDLEKMREEMAARGEKPMYDRRCRNRKNPIPAGKPYVLRFKTPLEGTLTLKDKIKGDIVFDLKEIDDFVVLRSSLDGTGAPTYNFCVVCDDVDMKISHIIRGDDHVNNTPKQILIMQAMGYELPVFAHVPMILGEDKQKLSKRHGATAVTEFRKAGYLPEAMINALARLGWSKGDQELFSMKELCSLFDLEGCGDSPSVFDRKRLDFLNAHYLKLADKDRIVGLIKEVYGIDFSAIFSGAAGEKLFKAITERAVTLKDYEKQLSWALKPEVEWDLKAKEQVFANWKPEVLKAFTTKLEALNVEQFVEETLTAALKATVAECGAKFPDLGKPVRVLLTGGLAGPDLGLILQTLGRDKAVQRLKNIT